jgi:hypothetical protein
MFAPELVVAAARTVRKRLRDLLPAQEAQVVELELGALLARSDAGEDVTSALLEALRSNERIRNATFSLLRGDRSGNYQALLGVPLRAGGRYACPASGCLETGDRLDDAEPEPRCPIHGIRMQRQ